MQDQTPAPRIATLDTIRGVAVMGILLMNIVAFAMPEAAYMNPRAYGGDTGANLAVWVFNFIFFDGKMRGLFSFLFGASTLLVAQKAAEAGRSPVHTHYARMAWLLAFGLAHIWLVWFGDILTHYAIVGSLAFLFRRLPAHKLVAIAILLIAAQTLLYAGLSFSLYVLAAQVRAPHPSLATVQQWTGFRSGFGVPSAAEISHDLASFRGPWFDRVSRGLGTAVSSVTSTLALVGLETLAYMLLGMAALKSGLLTGTLDRARYRQWLWIGFGIGVPAYAALAAWTVASDFAMPVVGTSEITLASPLRPAMIVAWASLIVLLARPGGTLTARISAAGRMAFSNYLLTSLICTTLFYGQGFALFGRLSRAELYPMVIAIWVLMLLWSKPWLDRFDYGPLEWLWRSLSRGSPQPMRRRRALSLMRATRI